MNRRGFLLGFLSLPIAVRLARYVPPAPAWADNIWFGGTQITLAFDPKVTAYMWTMRQMGRALRDRQDDLERSFGLKPTGQ